MIPSNLLPVKYQNSWCVAGGFAVCPALSTDTDVFVFVRELNQYVIDELRMYLGVVFGEDFVPQSNFEGTPGYDGIIGTERIGVVHAPGRTFDIVMTDAEDVHALLATFDISTSQVAIMPNGAVVRGNHWTPPHEAPLMLLSREKSKQRYIKYARRFGHDTVARIMEASIVEQNDDNDIPF